MHLNAQVVKKHSRPCFRRLLDGFLHWSQQALAQLPKKAQRFPAIKAPPNQGYLIGLYQWLLSPIVIFPAHVRKMGTYQPSRICCHDNVVKRKQKQKDTIKNQETPRGALPCARTCKSTKTVSDTGRTVASQVAFREPPSSEHRCSR